MRDRSHISAGLLMSTSKGANRSSLGGQLSTLPGHKHGGWVKIELRAPSEVTRMSNRMDSGRSGSAS